MRGATIYWVFGGHKPSGEPVSDLHSLDMLSLTWDRVYARTPPAARHAHTQPCVRGACDRLLMFGGAGAGSEPLGDLWELDLSALRPSRSGSIAGTPGPADLLG
jgi:hypothetical protein